MGRGRTALVLYDCNILGDPALAIWTQEPAEIDVDYPGDLLYGSSSYIVTVTSGGSPAEGMMCVLMSGTQMAGFGVTDNSGQALIIIPGGFSGEEAELVVSGYQCQPHHYPVNIILGIDVQEGQTDMTIYPVPFSDNLSISMNQVLSAETEIAFLLSDGQVIGEHHLPANSTQNTLTLNTSEWPAGVILMRVISGNDVTIRKFVHIKQ